MDPSHIRNFSIVAHIDHGKSTLADRLLELTGTVESRKFAGHSQLLDTMDLEQERGVTIKASAVQMTWTAQDGEAYELNLIDTPGHVDFGYEVSRALAACEGALLVIDATQGIEAQTLANLYLALENDLEIVPVINKIDLATADVPGVTREICELLGIPESDVIAVSAKEGTNVAAILEAVVQRMPPPPAADVDAPLQAMVFDSHYDSYKGVVAYVRVFEGTVDGDTELVMMATRAKSAPVEIGVFRPEMTPVQRLSAGEVGYIATGFKSVREARVGDTVTDAARPAAEALEGYQPAKPMVFASLYPSEADDYENLRDALSKLQLNDAALTFEPESSQALQFGFRCGFLGLFHMIIAQERLEREYGQDLVVTAPSVAYQVLLTEWRGDRDPPARGSSGPGADRGGARALDGGPGHHADRLPRHVDGAVPAETERVPVDRDAGSAQGSAHLRGAAGGDGDRPARSDQVRDARLRLNGLPLR